jgi:hypothetical protein
MLGRTDRVAVAAGPLEFVCEWPAFGVAETRAVIAQLILDAAGRSIGLWPENEG